MFGKKRKQNTIEKSEIDMEKKKTGIENKPEVQQEQEQQKKNEVHQKEMNLVKTVPSDQIEVPHQRETDEKIFDDVIDYFIAKEALLVGKLHTGGGEYENTKKQILKKARHQFELRCKEKDKIDGYMKRFNHYMWGYHVLEELIANPEIFDIKTFDENTVRIRRFGDWCGSDVHFLSEDDYRRFVRMICTRNKKNLSNINAQVKFSDNINNKDYILRFNISSEIINTSGKPSVHIRKLPKNKMTIRDLIDAKYMTEKQAKYLTEKFKEGAGFLFAGPTGSGKTYGMSALIDYLPKGKAGLVIQETDEIISDNPDIQFQHIVEENGEGKISYGLGELARFGLMDAVNLFVLGEVKAGKDAASLPMIAATGAQLMLSSHGNDELEAIYKVADYMKQSTGYDLDQCLRFLSGIKVIVYCNDFKVNGICENHGWDYKEDELKLVRLDADCKPIVKSNVTNIHSKRNGQKDFDIGDFILESKAAKRSVL